MLKIAICDDEQPIREYLKRLVEKCTEGGNPTVCRRRRTVGGSDGV